MGDLEYLKEDERPTLDAEAFRSLKEMIDSFKEYETEIGVLELQLKELKQGFNKLSGERIPEFLLMYGLTEIRIHTGEKIIVKEDISVSIDDAHYQDFINFLRSRGDDDIVKLQVAFDKMESEKRSDLLTFLLENEYVYESKDNVHAQTLKKYFKDILGMSINDPEVKEEKIKSGQVVKKEQLIDFAKIFTYYKTTIK